VRSICRLGLFLALAFHSSATAEVVFRESFESPVVSGFDDNTLPDNGNWIGSTEGFGANNRGLYNESFSWPDTAAYTTPYGSQAYMLNGPNNGMTTAENATGLVVTEGVEVKVSFNAAMLSGMTSTDYRVQLVAFDVAEDNSTRNDVRGGIAGTVLASASGTVTSTDFSEVVTFNYTPTGADPTGDELGIRLLKSGGSVLYDNIRVIAGHDFDPAPENEVILPSGDVNLSWTNMSANVGSDLWVDFWFGTDPLALVKVVDAAQNSTSTTVSAPSADVYYWRIDSYLEGEATGTPVEGDIFTFEIIDSDNDGLPDTYELANTSPASSTSLNPGDDLENGGLGDGLTNAQEYFYGTDPNNPDTDNDGLEDGPEINGTAGARPATNPLLADTDNDGLDDLIETNTGVWVSSADTGTSPADADWDNDGLVDGVETNDQNYIDQSATGSDPYVADSDADNVTDWYEVTAAFTDPSDPTSKPPLPYPLPDPDSSIGATDKPVKVYIMSGQSNMVGFGTVNGTGDDTLETMIKRQNKFPNLVNDLGEWTTRQDVRYRGVISDFANALLSPGALDSTFGPELGFGYIMGWYHDEPVLLLKSCTGNRGLGWDILPPGSPSYEYNGLLYAGYGEGPGTRPIGAPPATDPGWWAGLEWDRFFMDESEWVRPQDPAEVENVVDVLDNFATEYPDWAAQGFEIAGFVWWQGDKDRYDMGLATKYEENLVNLIDSLRNYYSNRYPGQVVPNAPFVLATLGQTELGNSTIPAEKAILDAQLAVDGTAGNYPLYAGNVKTVYSNPLSQGGASNSHYNKNAVTYMLIGDALGSAMVSLLETETPPAPNPITFEIAPSGVDATTIGMVATEATSANGPVEYYFENTTNSTNTGWTTDRTWNETGLTTGQVYSYQVKTRDSNGLEGEWSATVDATAEVDATAPTPDPMTFETVPTALGEISITMTATTALDINGVEYYFECTIGPGNDSGWQDSPTYTDTGLAHSTAYSYVVRARDKSPAQNVTVDSSAAPATTDSPDTTAPAPDPMTFDVVPTAEGENSISMTSSSASDSSGVEYYFEETTGNTGGTDSGWQDSTSYMDTGLDADTIYTYVVRARDKSPAQNVTADSAADSATTDAPDLTAPSISTLNPADDTTGIDINTDFIVTFDEDIAVGTGLITFKNLTDGTQSTIDITDGAQAVISGATLTISPSSPLLESKDYAIQIAGTVIEDLAGNSFAGISNDTTWNVTTADPPPPGLLLSEGFEEPDVSAADSEGSTSGAAPANWIRASDGYGSASCGIVDEASGQFTDPVGEQAFATRYTNSGLVSAEGAIGNLTAGLTYTISFDAVMDGGKNNGTPYNVWLVAFPSGTAATGSGSRSDFSGGFAGTILASASGDATGDGNYTPVTFEFTPAGDNPSLGLDVAVAIKGSSTSAIIDNVEVVSFSGPDTTAPTVSTLSPTDGAVDVAVDSNLVVTFDEDIAAGTGNITVKNLTDATEATIDIADAQVTIAGAQLTVNPTSGLLNSKDYAVQIAATAIEDLAGNAFAGISDDTTWKFSTVADNTFSDWISVYDVGAQTGPYDDADGDGVSNAAENYFGTDPSTSSAGLSANGVTLNGNTTFTFSHPISDTPASDLTAAYQWSTDLSTFLADGATDPNGTTVNFAVGTPADGQVTVTATLSGTEPSKVFVTVEVTQNP
jgi:hypothetical protein